MAALHEKEMKTQERERKEKQKARMKENELREYLALQVKTKKAKDRLEVEQSDLYVRGVNEKNKVAEQTEKNQQDEHKQKEKANLQFIQSQMEAKHAHLM